MTKSLKFYVILPVLLALTAMPVSSAFASQSYIALDPQSMVCNGLTSVGIGCTPQATTPYVMGTYQPKPVQLNYDIFSNTPVSSTGTSTSVNTASPTDLSGQKINIVSVPNSQAIYELVNGQKHLLPSMAIFYDYGYTTDMVEPISQAQLDKYPRAGLTKVQGSSTIYYLTEAGLVRQVNNPNQIFAFYGDRTQDIITISRKEFNFYPTDEYVYQISPLNLDVFQISTSGKRYLTPMAVARLGITSAQVAPVSKEELDSYKTLAPLVD